MKGKTNQMSEGEQYALQDEWGWEEEVCKEAEEEERERARKFAEQRKADARSAHSAAAGRLDTGK